MIFHVEMNKYENADIDVRMCVEDYGWLKVSVCGIREVEVIMEYIVKDVWDLLIDGFDLKARVWDINGNGVEGSGHIDGMVEAIVKAIIEAIVSLVEAVVEVASKVFEWIWDAIRSLLDAVLKPVKDAMSNWGKGLIKLISTYFSAASPIKTIGSILEIVNAIYQYILIPFIIISIFVVIAQSIEVIIKIFTVGTIDLLSRIVQFVAPMFVFCVISIVSGAIYIGIEKGITYAFIKALGDTAQYITGFASTQAVYFSLLMKLLGNSKVVPAITYSVLSLFTILAPKTRTWWKNLLLDILGIALAIIGVVDFLSGPDERLAAALTPFVYAISCIVVFSAWASSTLTLLKDIAQGTVLP